MKAKSTLIRSCVIWVLLVPGFGSVAQDHIDETTMVGFACFYEGRETEVVRRFGKLLKRKRYKAITQMLHSTNNAERLLAALSLERLASVGRVVLNEEEKNLIHETRISKELVAVCSGCFPSPGVPLQEAFDLVTLWRGSEWLDSHIR